MSSLPSDEVAADYREALEDLITNDRFSIANLTMIAKENIEHAQAIARTLTLHIKKAPPARKLPALYVLDSLVKNIGSPYTVYFGPSLHETFMLAYSQVDQPVRRKLEEMLRTWREPVPGSLSSTPVFPHSATQSIVEALNRFRAATGSIPLQQQQPMRPSSAAPGQQFAQQAQMLQKQSPYPVSQPVHSQSSTPVPFAQIQAQPLYYQPPRISTPVQYHTQAQTAQQPNHSIAPHFAMANGAGSQPTIDIRKLHSDIDDLTTDAKIDCIAHPLDQSKSKKLETLQSLKAFLDSGSLGEQDLRDVRDTITRETEKRNAEKLAAQSLNPPAAARPYLQQASYMDAQNQPQWPAAQPNLGHVNPTLQSQPAYPPAIETPAFLKTANLAELLRHAQQNTAVSSAQSTPPASYAAPPPPPPQHVSNTQVGPPSIPTETLSLLDQLRASGILSKAPTPYNVAGTPPSSHGFSVDDVPFTSASLKIPRPHLILRYVNEKPNQCTTCGRRFGSDDASQAKKDRHLDWHFKTKTRGLEAEQRGQNRSWYVDEHEWISSMEYEDDLGLEELHVLPNGAPPTLTNKEQEFVRTPSDSAHRNAVCPIDQEPFKSEWSADIQDFIWRDAVKVGDKYYHASCYHEAMKSKEVAQVTRASTPLTGGHRRTATPDSVLGKRKAEIDDTMSSSKARLKLES